MTKKSQRFRQGQGQANGVALASGVWCRNPRLQPPGTELPVKHCGSGNPGLNLPVRRLLGGMVGTLTVFIDTPREHWAATVDQLNHWYLHGCYGGSLEI
jgi:hypothetical protein